jgi:hypothetical protein
MNSGPEVKKMKVTFGVGNKFWDLYIYKYKKKSIMKKLKHVKLFENFSEGGEDYDFSRIRLYNSYEEALIQLKKLESEEIKDEDEKMTVANMVYNTAYKERVRLEKEIERLTPGTELWRTFGDYYLNKVEPAVRALIKQKFDVDKVMDKAELYADYRKMHGYTR